MALDNRNSRDLAITEGRYALVLDRTKGHVETLTGPYKSSLADTQTPVVYSQDNKTGYRECDTPQDAVQPYIVAKQGQYAILYNPSKEKENEKEFPPKGKGSLPSSLDIGNAINITGPISFALWWQQLAEVIDSHQLRSNQFLLVEVTNEAQAKMNWKKAEIKPAISTETVVSTDSPQAKPIISTESKDPASIFNLDPNKFTLGQRIIVRGLEISSFIPPTGMRVVRDEKTKLYVRDAATLESQQYCVLRSESGKKRYCQGPDVIFPTETETFVEENNTRIFKCIELNPNSGIHVMVIADYVEKSKDSTGNTVDKPIKSGTELFITGKDTPIYYPRPEHAIIKYDNENFIHYATAVPEGEGRYVLNKETGKVDLRRGPNMILLDPTKEIFLRRILSPSETELYYPGNQTALKVNQQLLEQMNRVNADYLEESEMPVGSALGEIMRGFTSSPRSLVADVVNRKSSYTPPRSLTLDNKYSGAVSISIWPGYCVQVVKKNGNSRIELGPKTVLLEYDESLTKLALSTGKPKTTDRLQNTVYLKIAGNQVTDVVKVESADSIEINIKLALKIKFTGKPENWFNVDNYVKDITDHVRSLLRSVAKKQSVLDFTNNATEIIRDSILGVKLDKSPRPGYTFDQSGVLIYDIEVMEVKVANDLVANLINSAHQDTIRGTLEIVKKIQTSRVAKEVESAERDIIGEKQLTEIERHKASVAASNRRLELALADLNVEKEKDTLVISTKLELQGIHNKIAELVSSQEKDSATVHAGIKTQELAIEEKRLTTETQAIVDRLKSVDPKLIAAIESSNDRDSLVKVVEQMGLGAYLKNDSVGATLSSILKGTTLENTAATLGKALRG